VVGQNLIEHRPDARSAATGVTRRDRDADRDVKGQFFCGHDA
jgi:hypothetical protein